MGIADRKSFPALVGTNSAMAVAEIPREFPRLSPL